MSLKNVSEMFLIFSVMEHVEIKFSQSAFWKVRELPLMYTVCQLMVSENKCFNTAEHIQIMTMNKYKRDLNNKNLKSAYNYNYLIRLLSKTVLFNSVNLQFAPCM